MSVHPFVCWIDSLASKNFQMADRVWNCPIMHCKPLIIDYIMYAFVLFSWHARVLIHTRPNSYLATRKFPFGDYFLQIIIDLLRKKWPLKQVFRGHFGHQVKFSGWKTVGQEYLASGKFVLASESNLSLATRLASWKVSLEPCHLCGIY